MSKNPQDSSEAGKEAIQKVADSLSTLFNLGHKTLRDPNAASRKLLLDQAEDDIQDNQPE